jgi:hypothetical protein
MKCIEFNCKNLSFNETNKLNAADLEAEIYHKSGDPENVNRIKLSTTNAEVEILPSKGLSVGEAFLHGKPVFWEPPIEMPDPDSLDLWSDEVAIYGKPAHGFTFLKTFNGGIELYGLKNWGMPVKKDRELLLLHGETSNIPVVRVEVNLLNDNKIKINGTFLYKTWKGDTTLPWHKRGSHLCAVHRTIILHNNKNPEIELMDEFENVSQSDFFVDWGYHITFQPEPGAKIIVPATKKEERSGGLLPEQFDTWRPANNPEVRTETGIIYKGLDQDISEGIKKNITLVKRPTLGDLVVRTSTAPYFQTWMCNGGAYSKEFTWSETGEPLFKKNWDGMGIEIGASALDHNGNTDSKVPVASPLKPGEKRTICISVKSA